MPPMLLALVCRRIRQASVPCFLKPVTRGIAEKLMSGFVGPQLKLHLDWMERSLNEQAWFAGERFSAADIQMSFPVEAAAGRIGLEERPRLRAFLDRIHARPAYRRAIERGGPFELPG